MSRLRALDALRGFCVLLMILHHLAWDLVSLGLLPRWILENLLVDALHLLFAGVFIALSGVSSRFSRNNFKRGGMMAAVAAGISAVTYFAQMPIWFGIIHFLAVATLLYAVLGRLLDKLPRAARAALYGVLAVLCQFLFPRPEGPGWLFWLGLGPLPVTYDYFPLLQWLPVYLLGTCAGELITEHKLPERFYRFDMPLLPLVGRQSLLIYLAHQPLMYALWWALGLL